MRGVLGGRRGSLGETWFPMRDGASGMDAGCGGRMRRWAALAVGLMLLGGCGFRAAEPPEAPPATTVPDVEDVSPAVTRVGSLTTPTLVQDSREREAQRLTVRVRNVN